MPMLSKYLRYALWEVHGKICFYCRDPLLHKNMHVDHVIPEKVFVGNESDVRNKYGLTSDFNFNALENFAPSCLACNSKRKGAKMVENGVPIWLTEISAKKEEVIRKARNTERELSLDLPDDYKEFFISSPDFMNTDVELNDIRKKDIPTLKNLALGDAAFPFRMTSPEDNNTQVPITTLSAFEKYQKLGYYGYATPEIHLETIYNSCLFFFEKLEKAKGLKQRISFRDYIRLLPTSILDGTIFSENDETGYIGKIGDFFDALDKAEIDLKENSINVTITSQDPEYHWYSYYVIEEILQADFSGNGKIEALLFIHYKSQGTLRFAYPCIVACINDDWVKIE